ncbi:unnamed protein product [Rhizophagus irregularis]|nr:unnamed protein product [Rhizophagus irregularis]
MAKYSKQPPHVDDDIIKEGMNKYKHHKNPYVMISRSISHRQSAKYIYYRNKRMFNLQGRNPIGPIPRPLGNVNVTNTQTQCFISFHSQKVITYSLLLLLLLFSLSHAYSH